MDQQGVKQQAAKSSNNEATLYLSKVHQWITEWLNNKHKKVAINGVNREWALVTIVRLRRTVMELVSTVSLLLPRLPDGLALVLKELGDLKSEYSDHHLPSTKMTLQENCC